MTVEVTICRRFKSKYLLLTAKIHHYGKAAWTTCENNPSFSVRADCCVMTPARKNFLKFDGSTFVDSNYCMIAISLFL